MMSKPIVKYSHFEHIMAAAQGERDSHSEVEMPAVSRTIWQTQNYLADVFDYILLYYFKLSFAL